MNIFEKISFVLLFALFMLYGLPGARAQRRVLTLQKALSLGRSENPLKSQYKYAMKAARKSVQVQKSDYLPNLRFVANVGHANEAPRIPVELEKDTVLARLGAQNTFTSRFELSQQIYAFGKTRHAVAAAKYQSKSMGAGYNQQMFELRNKIRAQFYQSIYDQKLDSIYSAIIPFARKLTEINRVRIKNGVGLSPEVLSSQADLQDMIARRASARNDYRKALVQIAHLTGQKTVNFDTRGQLPHLPEQKNLSVYSNVLYRRALTHRSDIDQLTYQSKQQKALAKSISAMKFPTLMLQSDFSYFGPEAFGYYSNLSSRGLKSYNWRVGIGINYPLFSGFKIRSQKKRNMALAQQYQEQKYELKDEIRTKIRTLLKDLETLQKLKKSNELFLKQVKANIRILKTSFKNGQIPRLTYIRAIIPKASAEAALVKTRSQIAETLVQLDAVVGTDISAILKNYSFKKTNEP